MNINSERENHVLETPAGNLCRKNNFTSPKEELKNLRLKNPDKLICAQLNINSVRDQSQIDFKFS